MKVEFEKKMPSAPKNLTQLTDEMEQLKREVGAITPVMPDNEDITTDSEGRLKLADKDYAPSNFSGMGRKLLRKNLIPVGRTHHVFEGFVEDVTLADMSTAGDRTTDISMYYWDRVRKLFVHLLADGIHYMPIYFADGTDMVSAYTDIVYMHDNVPYLWNGTDMIVDAQTQDGGLTNMLTQAMLQDANGHNLQNTIFHIQYDYTLDGESIEVPAGSILLFEGGSISSGTLTGDFTIIKAIGTEVFHNVTLPGNVESIDKEVADLKAMDNDLSGRITEEANRAMGSETNLRQGIGALDSRLQQVEGLAELSVEGGQIGIASATDFTNRTPEGDLKIPTVGAILNSVDDEPTAGSGNLVKSGGVSRTMTVEVDYVVYDCDLSTTNKFRTATFNHIAIATIPGEKYLIENTSNESTVKYAFATSDKVVVSGDVPLVDGYNVTVVAKGRTEEVIIPEGCNFLLVDYNGYTKVYKQNNRVADVIKASKADKPTSISILFIGNSLQTDVVAYLPLLLKEHKDVKFNIFNWYIGGATMSVHLDRFVNNTKCDIFRIWTDGAGSWRTRENSRRIEEVFAAYDFDVVCLQDYFTIDIASAEEYDIESFKNVISYIKTNYTKRPIEFVTLFHAVKRNTIANHNKIYAVETACIKRILRETEVKSVIPAGIAIKEALNNPTLSVLGDSGNLSYDSIHAQEGLPCMIQTYVLAQWLYEKYGLSYGIQNSQVRIISSDEVTAYNIPNPHGTPVGMSNENCLLAQQIAVTAYKEGKKFELDYHTENKSSLDSEKLITSGAVFNDVNALKEVPLEYVLNSNVLISSNGNWTKTNSSRRQSTIEVKAGSMIKFYSKYANYYTILNTYTPVDGESVDFAEGYSSVVPVEAESNTIIDVPENGHFLYFISIDNNDGWKSTGARVFEVLNIDDVYDIIPELPTVQANNLFDYRNALPNTLVNADGTLKTRSDNTYWSTGKVPVNPDICESIFINYGTATRVVAYDANDAVIFVYINADPRSAMSIVGCTYIIASFNTYADYENARRRTLIMYANSGDVLHTYMSLDTSRLSIKDRQYFNIEDILVYAAVRTERKFTDSFSLSLFKGDQGNKNMLISSTAMFKRPSGSDAVPTIKFSYIVNTTTVYESPNYIIGNSSYMEEKQWRIPPFPKRCYCKIDITIPEGVELYINSLENTYSNSINRSKLSYKFNAHGATQSIIGMETMAKVGFPTCVVIPKRTSDGIWVCFHDEVIGSQLKDADGHTPAQNHPEITGDVGIWDLTFAELQTYTFAENYLGEMVHVPTVEDFFRICARTGMSPMFSVHPIPTEAEYEEIKILAIKYNLLEQLELKPVVGGNDFSVLERVFGNSIKGVYLQVGDLSAASGIARLNEYHVDKEKVSVGVTFNLVSRPSLTAEDVKPYIDAGYRIVLYKPNFSEEECNYWMSNGVHEFTQNSNYSYGLNW